VRTARLAARHGLAHAGSRAPAACRVQRIEGGGSRKLAERRLAETDWAEGVRDGKFMALRQPRPPILVTGAHRSGTTWVGKVLGLHPGVVYVHEPFNMDYPPRDFPYRVPHWYFHVPSAPREREVWRAYRHLLRATASPIRHGLWAARRSPPGPLRPLRFLKHAALGLLRPRRVLIKDPMALLSAGWVHERFGASVVCTIRNPCAFAGSLKKWNWTFDFRHLAEQPEAVRTFFPEYESQIAEYARQQPDIVDQACLLWNVLHRAVLHHRRRWPGWMFVRYEDLAREPEARFRQVFDHLGLNFDDRIREGLRRFAAGDSETGSSAFGPRDARGSVETWKRRLTAEEAARVLERTREVAREFYEISALSYL